MSLLLTVWERVNRWEILMSTRVVLALTLGLPVFFVVFVLFGRSKSKA
jgi:hypothetical protein